MLFRFFKLKYVVATTLLVSSIHSNAIAQIAKHVILVSIDGFRPDFYKEAQWATPNLKIMAKGGTSADHVVTIFPSVTYPSHTTLVTGQTPNVHGILYNTDIDESKLSGEWITDYKRIKAKTLWEAAKEKKLTTASVSWPIATSAPWIDYNIPEIWSKNNPMDRVSASIELATPKGLFEEAMANATGNLTIKDYNISTLSMDENLSRMASYVFQKYKPSLLTIHLPNTDGAEHQVGRTGDPVSRAIAGADHAVSNLYDAVQKAGLLDSTVFLITGDHGFVTTTIGLSPNTLLKKAGLFDKAYFFSTGGSSFLKLINSTSLKEASTIDKKVRTILNSLPAPQQNLYTFISHDEIVKTGADTSALFALSGKNGVAFDNDSQKDFVHGATGGKHGYYPNLNEIYTGFILYGPGIKKQVIPELYLTDVAGIVSKILGLEFLGTEQSYQYLFKSSSSPKD